MSRPLVGVLALALVGLGATAALAPGRASGEPDAPSAGAIPAMCADGGRKQRAHEVGRLGGGSMVESAWASVGRSCPELPHVADVVNQAIADHQPPANASDFVKCRSAGFETGARETLTRLEASCSH